MSRAAYRYVTQLHLIPVIAVWDVAEGGCADNGAPSATTYATDITQLLGYLDGLGVTVPYIEAWNEPNASGVSASLAASYWTAANTICQTDGCTAIAGDMVDSADQGPQWAGSYLDSGGFTMPMGDLFTGAWVGSPP